MATKRIRDINPYTEKVITTIACATPAEVRSAVTRARKAQPDWAAMALDERSACMERAIKMIEARSEALAREVTRETGKPIKEARGEVGAAQRRVRIICEKALSALGRGPQLGDEKVRGTVVREPLGVFGIITAWNYPISVSCQGIVSALLAGNAVVFKPSELTPLAGQALGAIWAACVPQDVFIQIDGADETGKALVGSDVDGIGFVGSGAVGKAIMKASAKRLHRVSLELGGKDPAIICHDADIARVAKRMIGGALWNCGQECNSVERLYVDRRVAKEFLDRFVAEVKRLKMGDPMKETTDIGPMITKEQRRRVDEHVRDAVNRGAKVLTGGKIPKRRGFFYEPTVLTGVDHTMRCMREETFGPTAPVMAFDSEKEAVALANDSVYGLTASVWSADVARAQGIARRLVAGIRAVNGTGAANPHFPWGGAKESGLGRLMGPDPFAEFVDERSVFVVS
jgi:acyl-CoA reductase-like NAD-dependent aldehyde dehydrogenase